MKEYPYPDCVLLIEAAKAIVRYRDSISPLNFQLEKVDDYIDRLRFALTSTQSAWMDIEELREINARAATASPGPWKDDISGKGYLRVVVNSDDVNGICGFGDMEETDAADHYNAAFIAHARQDIPALLAYITELERQVFSLLLEKYKDGVAVQLRA